MLQGAEVVAGLACIALAYAMFVWLRRLGTAPLRGGWALADSVWADVLVVVDLTLLVAGVTLLVKAAAG
ncbi:MAG: hypothetical protein OHK0024_14940 [Thalassobaculales bacterium]